MSLCEYSVPVTLQTSLCHSVNTASVLHSKLAYVNTLCEYSVPVTLQTSLCHSVNTASLLHSKLAYVTL